MTLFDQADAAAAVIRARCGPPPELAVVLGSGLGGVADAAGDAVAVPYAELPHWPVPRVVGHAGRLVVGTIAGRRVAVLSGRTHVYEGYDAATAAFGVRVVGRLGARAVVLTNAAGGIDAALSAGTLMVIDDHINLIGNPLTGPNDERLGSRFPDMTEVYSRRLRALADAAGRARGIALAHGVYAAVPGPSYETPAEIRFLRTIGADAVGMSTVPEAIAARHQGIEVLGLSCITNMAAGVLPGPLAHDEVLAVARQAGRALTTLLEELLGRI
jgi:purine-nucleoside phosphorylase